MRAPRARAAAAGLALAAALAWPPAARGDAPPAPASPAAGELAGYAVQVVQPVVGLSDDPGALARHAVLLLAGAAPDAALARRVLAAGAPRDASGLPGLGFAGRATREDVAALHRGLATGLLALALRAEAPALAAARVAALRAAPPAAPPLDAAAQRRLDRVLDAAAGGDPSAVDGAVVAALQEAALALARDRPRAHGYLAVGLWGGLAATAACAGRRSEALAAAGAPLAALLERDAAFGGADRALAGAVRELSRLVAKGAPAGDALVRTLAAMRAVRPDAQ